MVSGRALENTVLRDDEGTEARAWTILGEPSHFLAIESSNDAHHEPWVNSIFGSRRCLENGESA